MSQAGAALPLRTAESVGLITTLSRVLSPWRKPLAVHDPGKIVLDVAVAVALAEDPREAVPTRSNREIGSARNHRSASLDADQPVIQAMSFGPDARSMARGQYRIHQAMPELIENALLNLPLD